MRRASSPFGHPGRLLALCATFTGCGGGASLVGAPAAPAVTIQVPVDSTQLATGSSLQVRVWNGDQLAMVERNGRCSTVFDPATGASTTRCPEGTSFQPVTPEEFEFPVSGLTGRVEVRTANVRVGEKFRILLSGRSRDGCNTTAADHVGTADSASVTLGSLEWSTTARACLGGPVQ
jgi:hypothetical protein